MVKANYPYVSGGIYINHSFSQITLSVVRFRCGGHLPVACLPAMAEMQICLALNVHEDNAASESYGDNA